MVSLAVVAMLLATALRAVRRLARVRALADATGAASWLDSIGDDVTTGAALGAAIGFGSHGVLGAWVGLAGGITVVSVRRRLRRSHRSRDLDAAAPGLARSLAAALRAGRSVLGALETAREEAVPPLRVTLDEALRRIGAGQAIDQALVPLGHASPGLAEVVETLRIGSVAAASLPGVLVFVADALEERVSLERDIRAGAAQARMSATVVGVMPFGFLLLTGAGDGPARLLLTDPLGRMFLGVGLVFELAGIAWTRKLMRV